MFDGFSSPLALHPPQKEVMAMGLLDSGFNCVLQMATGSGKTWLAERTVERTIDSGHRAIYVCPTRALAAELHERWQIKRPDLRIGIFTGDFGKAGANYPVTFVDAQLLLMTPERMDSCTRHWRSHWHWIPEVDLVVVDEFHMIGDGHRGARLEGAIMRLRRLNPFLRIVGLSATLGNRCELADWLHGIEYSSDWRAVPLSWRYVYFKRAEDKPDLLINEVGRVAQSAGKSLVFAQSRRRAEELAERLRNAGIAVGHHHAGLNYETRRNVEAQFRGSEIDVLVTTSTLEVGLNLPVRQVILYDLQQFDGVDFRPLPTNNVWQRVGRAGRFGLDNQGEAVLFAPAWGSKSLPYERGRFESCHSAMSDERSLQEQVVAELSSGLSRTRSELRVTFDESLAARQGMLKNMSKVLEDMIDAGLLAEHQRAEDDEREVRLKPTRIGRIASRHMLCPKTVLMFRDMIVHDRVLPLFDLLLIACASPDCEPILPVSFEEINGLTLQLVHVRSILLGDAHATLLERLGISPKRFLAALKMALSIRLYTQVGDHDQVAEHFACYPYEIRRLCESVERLLPAMLAISDAGLGEEHGQTIDATRSQLTIKIGMLLKMVEGGLNEDQATLTLVPGIGKVWARKLVGIQIHHIEDLAQAEVDTLMSLKGVSRMRAQQWIDQSTELMMSDEALILNEIADHVAVKGLSWPQGIDPYRLRRAKSLTVDHIGSIAYEVTGGMDPHQVVQRNNVFACDCIDYAKGHRCKHVLAVQRHQGMDDVSMALSLIDEPASSNHIDLFKLWML